MPRVVSATPRLRARAQAERRTRQQRVLRRTGWVVAAVIPLVLAGWVLLGSSLLAVHTVVVTGEHRLTAEQVEQAAAVPAGTPLARVDTVAVARRVKALRVVASVSVTRSWPRAIRVSVVERVPVAAVADGAGYDLLDASGTSFATVTQLPAGLLRLQAKGSDAEATRAALAVLHSLPVALRDLVGLLRAPSPAGVALVLRDNRVVIWGSATDAKAKGEAALALLRMPGTVFDVSSPGVVTRR
jgi:cell division protein FtsQ